MDIKEVPIGVDEKKYSPKVTAASEKYLKGFGLSAAQLSPEQKQVVFDFVKYRRSGWAISSFMSLVAVVCFVMGSYFFKLSFEIDDDLMSPKLLLLLGVFAGGAFSSSCGSLLQIVFHYQEVRRRKRVIEAFLPVVRGSFERAVA